MGDMLMVDNYNNSITVPKHLTRKLIEQLSSLLCMTQKACFVTLIFLKVFNLLLKCVKQVINY